MADAGPGTLRAAAANPCLAYGSGIVAALFGGRSGRGNVSMQETRLRTRSVSGAAAATSASQLGAASRNGAVRPSPQPHTDCFEPVARGHTSGSRPALRHDVPDLPPLVPFGGAAPGAEHARASPSGGCAPLGNPAGDGAEPSVPIASVPFADAEARRTAAKDPEVAEGAAPAPAPRSGFAYRWALRKEVDTGLSLASGQPLGDSAIRDPPERILGVQAQRLAAQKSELVRRAVAKFAQRLSSRRLAESASLAAQGRAASLGQLSEPTAPALAPRASPRSGPVPMARPGRSPSRRRPSWPEKRWTPEAQGAAPLPSGPRHASPAPATSGAATHNASSDARTATERASRWLRGEFGSSHATSKRIFYFQLRGAECWWFIFAGAAEVAEVVLRPTASGG